MLAQVPSDSFPTRGIADRRQSGARRHTDRMIPSRSRDHPSKPMPAYTFVSHFSFNSAAEKGAFFFWFLCVLPSWGGLV